MRFLGLAVVALVVLGLVLLARWWRRRPKAGALENKGYRINPRKMGCGFNRMMGAFPPRERWPGESKGWADWRLRA